MCGHISRENITVKIWPMIYELSFKASKDTLLLYKYSVTIKAATLIFISGRCSAISSTQEGISGSIYLVKNL